MPRSDIPDYLPGTVCLTLDIEPDYGRTDTFAALDRVGPFFDWVRGEQIPLTAFVAGRLIEQGHGVVDRLLAAGAAVELHGYAHTVSGFGDAQSSHADEIRRGTDAYRKRFGRVPDGYRAPAGVVGADDLRLLAELGYRYDSSVFPVRRPGRYDFRRLPHHPFRWEELDLAEFPVARLTRNIPAGLTFTNLIGPGLSAMLLARSAPAPAGPVVIDGHFHNIFPVPEARARLPFSFRVMYRLGELAGGLAGLRALVSGLQKRGYALGSLTAAARAISPDHLPPVNMAIFNPQ